MSTSQKRRNSYVVPCIMLLSVLVIAIAIFVSWQLALVMVPLTVVHAIRRKPWDGPTGDPKVNRNYRLPLTRTHVPRMRVK